MQDHGETQMRKTLVTIVFSALMAASSVQIAAAAQHPVGHHHAHKAISRAALTNDQFRNSNNEQLRDTTVYGMCGNIPGPCQ
jgi:hypothetical protein